MGAFGSKAQVNCLSAGFLKDVTAAVRESVANQTRRMRWPKWEQEDVAQTVLEAFLRRVREGAVDLSVVPKGWLNVAVSLTLKDRRRRLRRRPQDALSEDGVLPDVEEGSGWPGTDRPDGADSSLSKAQVEQSVKEAVGELPVETQQVVYKHYAEDKSYSTIGSEMGMPAHRAKYLLDGVRKALQKRLARAGVIATPALLAVLLSPRESSAVSVPPPPPRVVPAPSLWARLLGFFKAGLALSVVCTTLGSVLGLARAGLTIPAASLTAILSGDREGRDGPSSSNEPQDEETAPASDPVDDPHSTDMRSAGVNAPGPSSLPPGQPGNGVSGATESAQDGPRKSQRPSKPAPKTTPLTWGPVVLRAASKTDAPAALPSKVPVHSDGNKEDKALVHTLPGSGVAGVAPKELPFPDCHVAFSVPANGAAQQAITADILISWSSPVDVDSLADAIALTRDGQESVAFSIQAVDATTVKVLPSDNLRFWASYQLDLKDGISTPSGWPCEPASLAFSTIALAPEVRPLSPLPASGLWLDGSYLYTISIHGQALQVFTLPPSGVPSLEREIQAPAPVWGTVRALGAMVAVPAGSAGWWRVSPDGALSSVIPTGGDARDVAMFLAGGEVHVIVAAGAGGLRWFSAPAGDPAGALSDRGVFDPGVGTSDVWKVVTNSDGSTMAFVDGASLRVTSCQGPGLSGGCSTMAMVSPSGLVSDLALDGSHLFVGSNSGLFAYDLSAPDAPPTSPCGPAPECGVTDIHAHNGEVVAAAGPKGALRFQMEGANLAAKATYGVDDIATSVASDGAHVFAGSQAGPWSFEASTGVVLAGDRAGFGAAFDVLFAGNIAYVAAGPRGLLTYEVLANGTFVWRDQDLPPGMAPDVNSAEIPSSGGLALFQGLLLVADGFAGVSVYDLSDPAHPSRIRSIDLPDRTGQVVVHGERAYACAANSGAIRLDPLSDAPLPPGAELHLPGDASCNGMAVLDDTLYVVGAAKVMPAVAFLGAIDLSEAGPLSWKGDVLSTEYEAFRSIAVVNEHLVVATRTGAERRLLVIDPHAPDGPQIVWTGGDTQALHIAVAGSLAFVSSLAKGVAVYDMTDPLHPLAMGNIPFSGLAMSSHPRESDLFVLEAGTPPDPQAPRLAGRGLRRVATGPLPW